MKIKFIIFYIKVYASYNDGTKQNRKTLMKIKFIIFYIKVYASYNDGTKQNRKTHHKIQNLNKCDFINHLRLQF